METLNKHISAYILARGWPPRRLYVHHVQYMAMIRSWAAMHNPRVAGGFEDKRFRYGGATMILVAAQTAARIKEWDLAP